MVGKASRDFNGKHQLQRPRINTSDPFSGCPDMNRMAARFGWIKILGGVVVFANVLGGCATPSHNLAERDVALAKLHAC